MKRLFIIIAAATAGILASGCNTGNYNYFEQTVFLLTSSEEKSGGVTTVTTYEWTDTGAPKSEIRKEGGKKVYQDSYDPESAYDTENAVITCSRTYYDEAEQPVRQETRVRRYFSSDWLKQIGLKVYDAGADPATATPLSSWEEVYENNKLTAYIEKVGGITTLLYDGYSFTQLTTSYNITDSREGATVEKKNVTTYTDQSKSAIDNIVVSMADSGKEIERTEYEYEISGRYYYYAGHKRYDIVYEGDEAEEILAEEVTNYSNSDNVISYDTIVYEEDGETEKSKTSTVKTYKKITSKVYY